MKKLIIIAMAVVMLTFGNAAFAADLSIRDMLFGERAQSSQSENGKGQLREFVSKVKEKKNAVNKQQQEIKELRKQLSGQIIEIKKQINELRKNPASLSPEKINTVKQLMGNIEQANSILGSTQEVMKQRHADFKAAREKRKPGAYLNTLDQVVELQQKRIDSLNGIVVDIVRLGQELN